MRISLNLATRPFTDLGPAIKRLRISIAVLALVCVVLGVCLYLFDRKAADARARVRAVEDQIAAIQAERQNAQTTMRKPANAQLLQQADMLNQLFDEKSFSWTLAMENMETVLPAGVQVSAIEPTRTKDGHINVHLRVVGPHNRSVDLVRNLEHSKRFLEPRIVGETAETTNGPSQRMLPVSASDRFSFDLLADYNPPTPDEHAAKDGGKSSASGSQHSEEQPMLRAAPTVPRADVPQSGAQHSIARPPYVAPRHPTPGGPQ